MPIRKAEVYSALQRYVRAGLELLSTRCGTQDQLQISSDTWRRQDANTFAQTRTSTTSWIPCIGRHIEALHALPEYETLIRRLRDDPVIAPQLGKLMLSSAEFFQVDTTGSIQTALTDTMLSQVAMTSGALRFDERTLERLYSWAEDSLYEDSIEYEIITPILNLRTSIATIRLSPDALIDHMSDEETVLCIASGLIRPPIGSMSRVHIEDTSCLRLTFLVGKQQDVAPALQNVEDRLDRIIVALRLQRHGSLNVPGFVLRSRNWLAGATIFWYSLEPPDPMRAHKPYELLDADVAPLAAHWAGLESEGARRDGALASALRRFRFAGNRKRPEDGLVDLMIAAESLFLADTSDPQFRGELTYRLCIRAAYFIEIAGATKHQIFDLMKIAYGTRSAIVHGGNLSRVKLPDKHQVSMSDFVEIVEEHMRSSLVKYVRLAQSNLKPDWEVLILGP